MSMTEIKPVPPAVSSKCRSRWVVFIYNIACVVILIVLGIAYFKWPDYFTLGSAGPNVLIAIRAMWFGALGGIVISLKGVYDHCCSRGDWDDCFDLWHFGRPFSGALTGLITLVLLLAINPAPPNEPVVYAIAFIFGTQERRFFNFLSEVAALVVRVPNEDQDNTLKAIDVQPLEGKEGALVIIRGQGFTQGATVTFGTANLNNVVVSKDGKTIVGNVPAGTGSVDVTVTNPNGTRFVLADKFKY